MIILRMPKLYVFSNNFPTKFICLIFGFKDPKVDYWMFLRYMVFLTTATSFWLGGVSTLSIICGVHFISCVLSDGISQ